MHMLREDSPLFERFGEVYFSVVYPGVVKAWHMHRRAAIYYAVVSGEIKLALSDARQDSKTCAQVQEIFIGQSAYSLVKVPSGIYIGFKGIGVEPAIVAICSTLPHDPAEVVRVDPFDNDIPYDWALKHR
jgi:dTDP-4-dehydrorhamnose 3,5-epimerase